MNYFNSMMSPVIFFLILAPLSNAQTASTKGSPALRTQFNRTILIAADSAVHVQQRTIDSLSGFLDASFHRQSISIKILTDSLLTAAGDLLDPGRIESVYRLHKHFSGKLNTLYQTRRNLLHNYMQKYRQAISGLVSIHTICLNCTETDDFKNALSGFRDAADSSSNVFLDSATDLFENASDALVDSADVLSDSLTTLEETLIDNRSAEMDSLEEHSNKLIVSIDGNSHASFRGRDGGVSQGLLTPSITLRLLSGIRLLFGAGWTEKPEFHRDDSYLGIGYDFRVSPTLGAAIGYSYLWFTDSSTQNQSVFHHSIDGALSLETSVVNLGTGIGIFIGSEMEFAVTASALRYIPIGKCSIEPSLTISWGEQNGELTAQRLSKTSQGKGKGKGVGNGGGQQSVLTTTTNPANVFSIMSYEIHLPLNIKIGRLLLTPSVTGIFPTNVIDGSRNVPYLNVGLTATIDWIL
jgi:hypothetical protein